MGKDTLTAQSLQIWLKKGNGRSEKLVRSWEESEFQPTLAAQHSRDYEMLVGQYIAALGSRGDYISVKVPCTASDTTSTKDILTNGHLYVDLMDVTGVPADVQLAKRRGYGKYSPFDSPDLKVTDEMKVGIESEHLSVLLNQSVTASTKVPQYIAGVADARLVGFWDLTPIGDAIIDAVFELRLTPTANNVFLIRPDSKIWVLPEDLTADKGFFANIA